MRKKLTDIAIESYAARAVHYTVGDSACPGLRIRITPKGIKSFAFDYRDKATGKTNCLTIGRYPDVTLTKAREIANDARKTVANGGMPLAPKAQLAAAQKKTKTYADVVALYHEAKLSTLRSGNKVRLMLERIGRVYGWNARPIATLTDEDAAKTLAHIADVRGKKTAANRAKDVLHTMFKWAKQPAQKFITVNPFTDLPAPGGARRRRERFLTPDEIRLVWRALDEPRCNVSPDAATALRLILVTAARPGMVAGMIGNELRDLRGPSEHGPHWSLAAERMKNNLPFVVPLSPLALELLQPCLKADPAARLFDLGKDHLHEAARRLCARLGMRPWTPHDLRRTAATILDEKRYSLEQIGWLLAHVRKGVTAIYARWEHYDMKREMALIIERSLRETLDGEPAAVPIKTAA